MFYLSEIYLFIYLFIHGTIVHWRNLFYLLYRYVPFQEQVFFEDLEIKGEQFFDVGEV